MDTRSAEALHRQLMLLTMALVGGVVTFGGVVAALDLGGDRGGSSLDANLRIVIALGGVVVLVGASVIGRMLAASGDPAPDATAHRIRTRTIVSMALRESVGLLGGVLGLLTGDYPLMAGLVAASAATMILGIPGRARIEEQLREGRRR